jgi:hypothetical protein
MVPFKPLELMQIRGDGAGMDHLFGSCPWVILCELTVTRSSVDPVCTTPRVQRSGVCTRIGLGLKELSPAQSREQRSFGLLPPRGEGAPTADGDHEALIPQDADGLPDGAA